MLRLIDGGHFRPEEIRLLKTAIDAACVIAGLTDPNDPRRDTVAKAIIECAQAGERDPGRLRDCGVRAAPKDAPS